MEEIYGYFSVVVRVAYDDEMNKRRKERRKYLVQSGSVETACAAALAVAKNDIADKGRSSAYVISARLLSNISGVSYFVSPANVWVQARILVDSVEEKSHSTKKTKASYIYNVHSMNEAVETLGRIANGREYEVESIVDAGYYDFINAIARKEMEGMKDEG